MYSTSHVSPRVLSTRTMPLTTMKKPGTPLRPEVSLRGAEGHGGQGMAGMAGRA